MAVETVRVELLGASFAIQTDETREYMESVLAYLRDKVAAVRSSTRVDDPLKTAILTGIFLVDELYRERVESAVRADRSEQEQHDEAAKTAERIIARIDQTLGFTNPDERSEA
ncbi:MAG TPA: cell division protein ZapA [Spirochaetales bacterium]|nr:cell division protein ZapA [Spirochaetales bacterium]